MPRNHYFLPTLDNLRIRDRGYTPHWEMPNATYSITYRLDDSIAPDVFRKLRDQREAQKRRAITAQERLDISRRFERTIDDLLDRNEGACHLRDCRIAEVVLANMTHFDGKHYEQLAWCVMPNHVHVVMRAIGDQSLAKILHSWKSYTSKRANDILGTVGTFWQSEYYDRIVRDDEDLERTIQYVLGNPAKAGLANWPWVGHAGQRPA
jgi:REP element-mobilizing transposase RayT